jgi:hypothetical protein
LPAQGVGIIFPYDGFIFHNSNVLWHCLQPFVL